MADKDKDKGDLRKRLVQAHQPEEADSDYSKLTSELAGTMGKTVERAADLGLSLIEDVSLRLIGALAPAKPAQSTKAFGVAASLFNRSRASVPAVTGKMANKLTGLMVGGGFELLRTLHQAVRNPRKPG
jgi:hypothetical protein